MNTYLINDLPDSCACFSARKLARRLTRAYDSALAPAGLSSTQFSLLAILYKCGSKVNMSKLSELADIERTTLTRNAAVLEKHGLIKSVIVADARIHGFEVTQDGKRRLEAALPLWQNVQQEVGADKIILGINDISVGKVAK